MALGGNEKPLYHFWYKLINFFACFLFRDGSIDTGDSSTKTMLAELLLGDKLNQFGDFEMQPEAKHKRNGEPMQGRRKSKRLRGTDPTATCRH